MSHKQVRHISIWFDCVAAPHLYQTLWMDKFSHFVCCLDNLVHYLIYYSLLPSWIQHYCICQVLGNVLSLIHHEGTWVCNIIHKLFTTFLVFWWHTFQYISQCVFWLHWVLSWYWFGPTAPVHIPSLLHLLFILRYDSSCPPVTNCNWIEHTEIPDVLNHRKQCFSLWLLQGYSFLHSKPTHAFPPLKVVPGMSIQEKTLEKTQGMPECLSWE